AGRKAVLRAPLPRLAGPGCVVRTPAAGKGLVHIESTGTQAAELERDYTPEELVAAIEESLKDFKEGDILTGTIVKIDRDEVLVDIGYKSEGRKEFTESLKKGERRKGTVSSIVNCGAFVDLGGVDGLVHVSELSWKHVDDPSEVVAAGQEVEVEVLDVDLERERVSLSL